LTESALPDVWDVAKDVPRRGLLRLRFLPELEAEFLAAYRASARRWVRLSLLVALSTVLGFAVIDHWVLGGSRRGGFDFVRFAIQLSLVLFMLALTARRFYARFYQPAIQICAPLFALGHVWMAMTTTPEQLPLVAARLILVAFFFYFMLGMTLHAALRSNAILVVAYATAAAFGAVAPTVATYQLFVLGCANLIGAAGCYALEHANRVAFLERRRLAEVAMHDGLTGLLNRTALEERFRRLWQKAVQDRLPVSFLLIDIDHFKAFNDRYGHQAGDRCLREIAHAVREAAHRGPQDLVARYGGEELIVVLFGADRAHAESVCRGVIDAVSALRISHEASDAREHVSVSIGAATLEPDSPLSFAHEAQDVGVQLADRALYLAKARGRNGWVYWDGTHEREAAPGRTEEPFRDAV
jgi:diguanylate cyclase (GGDEF) domain